MTNKFKTLLKTTAALATLMVGSQSWGTLTGEDDQTYLTGRAVTGKFAAFVASSTGPTTGAITTPAGCQVYFNQGSAMVYSGGVNLGAKNTVYLNLAEALSAANFTSSAGVSSLVVTNGANVLTLNGGTQSQFGLMVESGVTVNLAATGALTLPITVLADQTLTTGAAVDAISSKLTGAGDVTLDGNTATLASDLSGLTGKLTLGSGVNNVTTDLSKFKGTLVTGGPLDISTKLNNEKLKLPINLSIPQADTVTVGSGTMKKVTVGSTSGATIDSTGNVVIEELVLTALSAGTFNLGPGAGATITIKKIDRKSVV